MKTLSRLALALGLLLPALACADAIVRSQAMFADTIAEFFVEGDGVRVELEIGMNDIGNFRNLLPDPIYEGLEFGQRPLAERLVEFFASDLVIADGEQVLAGELRSIGPRNRIVRDEITGEEFS